MWKNVRGSCRPQAAVLCCKCSMRLEPRITKARIQTQIHTIKYFLFFHGNNNLRERALMLRCKYIAYWIETVMGMALLGLCLKLHVFNLFNPAGHVMHQQFNIQQLYILPTLYL